MTVQSGLGHLQKGHGLAFADLDHDGDQDLYHQLGGFYPVDRFANALFVNTYNGGHFFKLELRGRESNRMGLGCRVTVMVSERGTTRRIHRAHGSVSSFGGSPLGRLEIGLGSADVIERLEIRWPVSKTRQVFTHVPLDRMIRVVEGRTEFVVLEHPSYSLGEE